MDNSSGEGINENGLKGLEEECAGVAGSVASAASSELGGISGIEDR